MEAKNPMPRPLFISDLLKLKNACSKPPGIFLFVGPLLLILGAILLNVFLFLLGVIAFTCGWLLVLTRRYKRKGSLLPLWWWLEYDKQPGLYKFFYRLWFSVGLIFIFGPAIMILMFVFDMVSRRQ